jgi:hypothetical protein
MEHSTISNYDYMEGFFRDKLQADKIINNRYCIASTEGKRRERMKIWVERDFVENFEKQIPIIVNRGVKALTLLAIRGSYNGYNLSNQTVNEELFDLWENVPKESNGLFKSNNDLKDSVINFVQLMNDAKEIYNATGYDVSFGFSGTETYCYTYILRALISEGKEKMKFIEGAPKKQKQKYRRRKAQNKNTEIAPLNTKETLIEASITEIGEQLEIAGTESIIPEKEQTKQVRRRKKKSNSKWTEEMEKAYNSYMAGDIVASTAAKKCECKNVQEFKDLLKKFGLSENESEEFLQYKKQQRLEKDGTIYYSHSYMFLSFDYERLSSLSTKEKNKFSIMENYANEILISKLPKEIQTKIILDEKGSKSKKNSNGDKNLRYFYPEDVIKYLGDNYDMTKIINSIYDESNKGLRQEEKDAVSKVITEVLKNKKQVNVQETVKEVVNTEVKESNRTFEEIIEQIKKEAIEQARKEMREEFESHKKEKTALVVIRKFAEQQIQEVKKFLFSKKTVVTSYKVLLNNGIILTVDEDEYNKIEIGETYCN